MEGNRQRALSDIRNVVGRNLQAVGAKKFVPIDCPMTRNYIATLANNQHLVQECHEVEWRILLIQWQCQILMSMIKKTYWLLQNMYKTFILCIEKGRTLVVFPEIICGNKQI